jgi:O-antigen/teichoic acid export membrane protein
VAVFTHLLPPEEYGLYILVFTTVLFVHTIAFSWINQAALRYFERYRAEETPSFQSTHTFGFLTLAVLMTAAWYGILLVFGSLPPRSYYMFSLGPPSIWVYSGGYFILTMLRAERSSTRYSALSAANAVLKFTCGLAAILLFERGADGILMGLIAAGAVVFGPEWLRWFRRMQPRWRFFSTNLIGVFFRYGMPVVALAFANIVLAASDRFLIEYFLGASAVGVYSAGYKIIETGIMLFVNFLMLAAFPALVETFEKSGRTQTQALMQDLLGVFLGLVFPVLVGSIVLAKEIVGTILGSAYFEVSTCVPWIAAGAFFMGLSMFYNKSFELAERTSMLLILYTAAAALNVVLNLFMIPRLGIEGAAFSTLAAYAFAWMLSAAVGSRWISWRFPWKTSIKVLFGSAIMGTVVALLPGLTSSWGSLLYKIVVGAIVYAACLMVTGRRILADLLGLLTRDRLVSGESSR